MPSETPEQSISQTSRMAVIAARLGAGGMLTGILGFLLSNYRLLGEFLRVLGGFAGIVAFLLSFVALIVSPWVPLGRMGVTAIMWGWLGGLVAVMFSLITVIPPEARGRWGKSIIAEMTSLESGVKMYRDQHGQIPPCMAALPMSGIEDGRAERFMRHVRHAWPRCDLQTYATIREAIFEASYNYSIHGRGHVDVRPLDLDTLDPAEALVFWLGGFSAPVSEAGTMLTPSKLIGFHSDPANPFKLDKYDPHAPLAFVRSRTPKLFDFDETRLTDADEDGWLEYIPSGIAAAVETAPYVYFDAGMYGMIRAKTDAPKFSGYPIVGRPGASPRSAELRNDWGTAVPYASKVSGEPWPAGGSIIQWVNPEGLQIVCSGRDGRYCDAEHAAEMRLPVFPNGQTYYERDGFTKPSRRYDELERDNLTSFADSMLSDQADRNQ